MHTTHNWPFLSLLWNLVYKKIFIALLINYNVFALETHFISVSLFFKNKKEYLSSIMITWEREREGGRGSVRKGSWQKVVIMGKDKKTKKRTKRERERRRQLGWCSVSVCVVCGYGVEVFSFILLFWIGGEREGRQVLCESGGCVGDVLSVSVTFAPTLPSRD